MFFRICNAPSDSILIIKIVFLVPVSLQKPRYYSPISGLILLLDSSESISKLLEKRKNFVGSKYKSSHLLCNVNRSIWHWILDNFFIDEKATSVVLQKNTGNTLNRRFERWRSYKENGNKKFTFEKDQKETV